MLQMHFSLITSTFGGQTSSLIAYKHCSILHLIPYLIYYVTFKSSTFFKCVNHLHFRFRINYCRNGNIYDVRDFNLQLHLNFHFKDKSIIYLKSTFIFLKKLEIITYINYQFNIYSKNHSKLYQWKNMILFPLISTIHQRQLKNTYWL